MGVGGLLTALALRAPVPVFPASGAGGRAIVQDLGLEPLLRLVDSPREANVLLLAGDFPATFHDAVRRVHDSLSHPRCTVWCGLSAPPNDIRNVFPVAALTDRLEDAVGTILRTHRALLTGVRESESALLPDLAPEPWRGVGPYGQGGSGMTGGAPYGRPMAGLADDRDGLRLDTVPVSVGPFFRRFPPGLRLDFQLGGDVVLDAAPGPNPFAIDDGGEGAYSPLLRPFVRALTEPVRIAELELARARSHLRWLSEALMLHGLHSLGARALRLAVRVGPDDSEAVLRLARWIGRTQVLRWSIGGVGRMERRWLEGSGAGPVARAAGVPEDARMADHSYRRLGFKPVVHEQADAAARWRQRLAEVLQSLDLASRSGDRCSEPVDAVESPRGRLGAGRAAATSLLELIPTLVAGREWGDAVAAVVSLDLDLEEAAVAGDPAMQPSVG